MLMFLAHLGLFAYCFGSIAAKCFEPSPAFPVPTWSDGVSELRLRLTFETLESKLLRIVSQTKYDNSSYSVEVTSKSETLWSSFHTAKNLNKTRPGDSSVDSSSQYRIASITKVFTTLALLYQANVGNVSLDTPVSFYIKELDSSSYELPWKDITLRALASQLSGIPREFAQSDLSNLPNPQDYGFPYVPKEDIPIACDEYDNYRRACTREDLLERMKDFQPLFAPNQKSTYSNLNFELLGLVIENVTGMTYEDYIQTAIFNPLNLTSSTFDRPRTDEHAVLPLGFNYWDIAEGVQNPAGGIYASSSDLSKFLRYVLTHYNALTTGVNWLLPGSWSEGIYSFYGMPWEIFRTDKILEDSRRPVTFVGKSGGLPGYSSRITIMEDYGLGVTILVGGNAALLNELVEAVTVDLVRAAEEASWYSVFASYAGHYVAEEDSLNSSLTLEVSQRKGLYLPLFISNGTDVFAKLLQGLNGDTDSHGQRQHVQLVPTLLFEDEKNQNGEIWRSLVIAERSDEVFRVWDDFCVTDIDQVTYATVPVNKVIFWRDEDVLELPAFRVRMTRRQEEARDENRERLVVQA